MTTLVSIIVALIIVGAVLYLVNLAPIDGRIKQIIFVIVLVVLLIAVIQWITSGRPLRILSGNGPIEQEITPTVVNT
jgi:hypothetical protein